MPLHASSEGLGQVQNMETGCVSQVWIFHHDINIIEYNRSDDEGKDTHVVYEYLILLGLYIFVE